ncbi:GIN domain-containing protein [Flagellimonas sp.]|uniref:GIN domain-containing protein n=1 Tax=Flagellimonas sp. TaxID=2058762 RepID=UPI003B52DB9A
MKNRVCILLTTTALALSACYSDIAIGVVDEDLLCSNGTLKVVGTGPIVTESIYLGDFKKVINLQGVDVRISQGNEQIVTATGHANVINRLESEVNHGGWTIALEEGCYSSFELSIDIVLPELEQVVSKSSGDITINGFDAMENLGITSWSSGNIKANSGFGDLQNLRIDTRGSGDLNLYEIPVKHATIYSAGSGECNVRVQNNLDVTIKGSGNVNYQGAPSITQQIIGSGQVVNAN